MHTSFEGIKLESLKFQNDVKTKYAKKEETEIMLRKLERDLALSYYKIDWITENLQGTDNYIEKYLPCVFLNQIYETVGKSLVWKVER